MMLEPISHYMAVWLSFVLKLNLAIAYFRPLLGGIQ